MEEYEIVEMIRNMKVSAYDYINIAESVEILLSGSQQEIAKLKKKSLSVKAYNKRIEEQFRAADGNAKKELIRTYKSPKIDDEFISSELK